LRFRSIAAASARVSTVRRAVAVICRPACADPYCSVNGSCSEGSRLMRRQAVGLLPDNDGRRRAVKVIAVCLLVLLADSAGFAVAERIPFWHGLYVILANAETFGGDVPPTNTAGYVCNTVVLLVLIPLFGAVISFFTSGLTEAHVKNETAKLHEKLDSQHSAHAAKLDEIHRKLNGGDVP